MDNAKKTAALKDPPRLTLSDGAAGFYGGNQAWFKDSAGGRVKRKIKKGCSAAAACNILMYMSAQSGLEPLYTGARTKADYAAQLNEIARFLKIGAFGVWAKRRFIRGVLSFAAERGVTLAPRAISRFNAEKAADFIREALDKDRPVAMLIGFNPRLKKADIFSFDGGRSQSSLRAHWVTVTELYENGGEYCVKVSTWGKYAFVSLNDYAAAEPFKKALIYFDPAT